MLEGNNTAVWISAAITALLSSTAIAQDTGGLDATLTFSQGLTYSDLDGTRATTNLGFGLTSITRSQSLDLRISGRLEQDFDDRVSTQTIDPNIALSYGIESRQTALTTDISFRQSDADSFVVDSSGAPGILVLDEGDRTDLDANLGLSFGRDALFGGTVTLGYSGTDYSNTTDTGLVDQRTTSAGFDLRFEIDRRITATLGYDWSQIDRDTGRDVVNQNISTGAQFAITPILDASVSVGISRISVTDSGIETVDDGLFFDLAVTQARPLGTLRYSLGSDLSESGRRSTATVGGTFETRRGTFAADLGLSAGDDDQIRPIFTLSYSDDLPRGSYSVSLAQRFATASDGNEVLNSRFGLSWNQELTRTSRMSSNMTYQITDTLGTNDDTTRLELGISYSHDLTERWAATTNFTHSLVDEDGMTTERENEIFIGLETSLGWRP